MALQASDTEVTLRVGSHYLTLSLSWKERGPWAKSSRRDKKDNVSSSGTAFETAAEQTRPPQRERETSHEKQAINGSP